MDITSGKFIGTLTYPELRSLLEERERGDFRRRTKFPEENDISEGEQYFQRTGFLEEDEIF